MTRYTFEEVKVAQASDEELTPILARVNEVNREIRPRSVDMTLDELRMFAGFPGTVESRFLTRDGTGEVVGTCETHYSADGTNPETLRCGIFVWPEFRRAGAGTAMLGHIARIGKELARTKLLSYHFDTVPAGGAFAAAIGATEGRKTHENVLHIADLDAGLMQRWVEEGDRNAPGYTVRVTEGDWPEELFEDIANLLLILERDMPRSDGQAPRNWDAELVRELQEQFKDGVDVIWGMAFDGSSGKAVGMSEMFRRKTDPTTWIVTTTMVDPDHRGKSIGKWLKGAVNLAALEAWPEGIYEETANAFSNDAMLAINHAMGFRHEMTTIDVEITVDRALAWVASRS
ncbi:MAG TPA: GNAT family N-acetyltransferase [Acidimicrobiia bacterium]|nr:GNAT family N-acetyltransferase [Acidimicrobiia bacterium]